MSQPTSGSVILLQHKRNTDSVPGSITSNSPLNHDAPAHSGKVIRPSTNSPNNSKEEEPHMILKQLRLSNINKVIIGHLNSLINIVKGTIDILLVSETKIDASFPQSQFCIDGYIKPFRLDRNSHGGGIMIFIRDDIPCKRLYAPKMDIEAIFFEINLNKTKWLCCGGYNKHNKNIARYLRSLEESLDSFIKNYLLILGDLDAVADDIDMKY